MGWRQPSLTRPVLTLVLVLVLLLHALFALVLWREMQPKKLQLAQAPVDQALIVHFLDNASTPRFAPPPAPPTPPKLKPPKLVEARSVLLVTHKKPRSNPMTVQDHQAVPAPAAPVQTTSTLSLFAKDGSVRLPPATAAYPAAPIAKAKPAEPADDRQIMQHDTNRMHYKATRFEKYFPPPNETAGGAVGRHIGDVLKEIAKSVCDPKKPSTASNLLCGVPPIPPSPKEGDERLNLPPPPLALNPNPPTPPSLASCIAEYKATKPLSSGCPLNTPDLAFKAEMRQCIDLFRGGKRLKTWCPTDTPERAAADSSTPAASPGAGSH